MTTNKSGKRVLIIIALLELIWLIYGMYRVFDVIVSRQIEAIPMLLIQWGAIAVGLGIVWFVLKRVQAKKNAPE